MTTLRIATRRSPLALWQARYVAQELERQHPGLQTSLVEITTTGDRILGKPLATVGGKGLFLKELENALLSGEADIAVHSMKDVTVDLPPGLRLCSYCVRADPRDALVSNRFQSLTDLPHGARIGSSSLRRQCQIKLLRPELNVSNLRGNVNTRLSKLDQGEYDAIVLAAAGLQRLGMSDRIQETIEPESMLPAPGQGIMGIECRADDLTVIELTACLNDGRSETAVTAERAANAALNGGCQVPIAAFAEHTGADHLRLRALVGAPDGSVAVRSDRTDTASKPEALGQAVAMDLIRQGAMDILNRVYATE